MARDPRLFLLLFFFLFAPVAVAVHNVTYDARSLIIDGERKLIISGSIHYPRSVPSMWPGLVAAAKAGGLNTIETYVFWNGHEPSPGNYYFQERFDLVKFAKIVRDAGLYMILRIGPFIGAEWTYGGIPVWLHYVPGTVFRTNNEPFKRHMESFVSYIVNLMKREQLFASQGGHIILAQVENEYGFYEGYYGDAGKQYAMWAAHMALNQGTGVPWVMCQQDDAPDPVINTCNSFYCDQFTPNSPSKPKFWTENWPGWFHTFGEPDPHRPPEDIAFSVARFFQKGGSLQNYYMYHGGTHYGRTTGGPLITTSYDYNAPIDEYGLPRLPKWGHLRELHRSIKLCEHTLLYGESKFVSAGPLQEVNIYEDKFGGCVAFLANIDEQEDKLITFRNVRYSVPPWSVSILPDCKNVVFNTAKAAAETANVIQKRWRAHFFSLADEMPTKIMEQNDLSPFLRNSEDSSFSKEIVFPTETQVGLKKSGSEIDLHGVQEVTLMLSNQSVSLLLSNFPMTGIHPLRNLGQSSSKVLGCSNMPELHV